MGIAVMVIGESGSGKSTSIRNFEADEVGVINVAGKPLPFRKKIPTVNSRKHEKILHHLEKASVNAMVIDDSQYTMAFTLFDKIDEGGFTKFNTIAKEFLAIVRVVESLPPDVIVYFLHHSQTDEFGRVRAKTVGKMLDSQITVEGLFPIVLHAKRLDKEYIFETQNDGHTTAKSPMDMFTTEKIPNDLKAVDTAIREFWGLQPLKQQKGTKNETD